MTYTFIYIYCMYLTDALIFFRLALFYCCIFQQKLFIIFNRVFNYRQRSITDFLVVKAKIVIRYSKASGIICIYIYYRRLAGVSLTKTGILQRSFNYRTSLSQALFPSLNLSDTQLVTRALVFLCAPSWTRAFVVEEMQYFVLLMCFIQVPDVCVAIVYYSNVQQFVSL